MSELKKVVANGVTVYLDPELIYAVFSEPTNDGFFVAVLIKGRHKMFYICNCETVKQADQLCADVMDQLFSKQEYNQRDYTIQYTTTKTMM